jgi:ribonuclease D
LALPESDLPQPAIVPDERTIGKERISATVEAIRKAAEARQVDARLVSSKSDVVMLLHEGAQARPHNHRLLRGWRAELLTGSLPVPQ